jgi:threonylcarbamoyladenosine tRNA methylthiotransferase MtaB
MDARAGCYELLWIFLILVMCASCVINFGCRLNAYESEVIREHLKNQNIQDVIVINTCAVTKEAERQARQTIRKCKRDNPDKSIVVTGCSAQVNPAIYAEMTEVSLVLGNADKLCACNYHLSDTKIIVNDLKSLDITALHMVEHFEEKVRAFVQIQTGCNHYCSYCIIPKARGASRSVPVGGIVEQVKKLLGNGCREIVLTGVDLTDYGKDLPIPTSLGKLVGRLFKLVPDLARLYLSSLDVAEIDDDLLELMTSESRLMPYFHFSIQSGDDNVLAMMKRRHRRWDILRICSAIKQHRPLANLGADMIAGFPTEDEEMFKNSLAIIQEAELSSLHVFPYSSRPGTTAAKLPKIPLKERKERAKILRDAGIVATNKLAQKMIGQGTEVIMESKNSGRSSNFLNVKLSQPREQGEIVKVLITDSYADGTMQGVPTLRY